MNDTHAQLSPQDQQALDALMAADFDVDQLDPELRERGQRLMQLLGVLESLPTPEPGDLLVARTMKAVREARQNRRIDRQIDALTSPAPGVRWPEIIAVAAMVLITVGFILPTFNNARDHARQMAGQANLAAAAAGFTTYAADHDDAMPSRHAETGDPWWHLGDVTEDGRVQSNSANLFLLLRTGHAQPVALVCPANEHALARIDPAMIDWPTAESVSFSYQNQFTRAPQRWSNGPVVAILADKNPRFGPGEFHAEIDPTAISGNHASLGGQNVLLSNGSVRWVTEPVIGGDNIWQADGVDDYEGNETQKDADDSFVVW